MTVEVLRAMTSKPTDPSAAPAVPPAAVVRGPWRWVTVEPEHLHGCWALVREGLEALRAQDNVTFLPEDIYTALKTRGAMLRLAYLGDTYAGFGVFCVITDPFTQRRSFLIWSAYSVLDDPALRAEGVAWTTERAADMARELGIDRLVLHTSVPKLVQRFHEIGFEIREFVMERVV